VDEPSLLFSVPRVIKGFPNNERIEALLSIFLSSFSINYLIHSSLIHSFNKHFFSPNYQTNNKTTRQPHKTISDSGRSEEKGWIDQRSHGSEKSEKTQIQMLTASKSMDTPSLRYKFHQNN
jgi:hypothetical protein